MSDFKLTIELLKNASYPEDVFGPVSDVSALQHAYRKLAKIVHPDLHASNPAQHQLSLQFFPVLGERKAQAEYKLKEGTYGNRTAPAAAPAPFTSITVEFKGKQYTADGILADGDICRLYSAGERVLKVSRIAANNDLVANEAAVLSSLYPPETKEDGFLRYLPKLEASFVIKSPGGKRRVNVLHKYEDVYSFAQVRAAYPQGIDFRDAAWMLRRQLEVLGYVHRQGYVHGAVLPPHCLIHTEDHRGLLVDWSYAVKHGERIRALSVPYKHCYAPEILNKLPAASSADIYMWARCGAELMHVGTGIADAIPLSIKSFLAGCMLPNPSKRPTDAWALYDEFGELLERLVGKPTFRPFHMPPKTS